MKKTLNNNYILYSINVEDAQNVANPPGQAVRTGDTIDRDLTDSEIKKVEERLGDYLPNWFDLPRSNVSCHVGFILSNMAGEKNLK
jgi:hypothetical protein